MPHAVECRSDYTYAQRPSALTWEGRRREVAEVLSEWRAPGGKSFRVRTVDGAVFGVTYVEQFDEWQIQLIGDESQTTKDEG
jgi:hypothetical protein